MIDKQDNVHYLTTQDLIADQMAQMLFGNSSTAPFRDLRSGASGGYGINPDGTRNYNQLFGYGQGLTFSNFYAMWLRGGLARVIVDKVAKSCWRDVPELYVGEDRVLEDDITRLKDAGLFTALERADILNRIGSFSALLVGVPDGMELYQPLGSASAGNFDGLYFNAYSYGGIELLDWNNDPASPEYGLPMLYQLQTRNYGEKRKEVAVSSRVVNAERVVHFAEGALDNDIEGSSALMPIYNALIDKDKIRGSAAEAFFRNARQKFNLAADKDAKLPKDDASKQKLKEEVQNFVNGWQDFIRTQNMTVKEYSPSIASNRDAWDAAIEEISGTTGIPIRVLTGKGGGQLAGSEDRATYNALVADRQDSFCTGRLLRALRIIDEAGVIDLPDGVRVEWPEQGALSATEESEVIERKARALNSVAAAVSSVGGDEMELASILTALGFEDIDTTDGEPD